MMSRLVAVLVSVTLAGLLYVYTEIEAMKTGYTIRKQQEIRMLCVDRARALQCALARLKAPHNLEQKLLAQRTRLDTPKSWQKLVLPQSGIRNTLTAAEPVYRAPFFLRFFVGTAQAEAKESANR